MLRPLLLALTGYNVVIDYTYRIGISISSSSLPSTPSPDDDWFIREYTTQPYGAVG